MIKILLGIVVVLCLLTVCIAVDSADIVIDNTNTTPQVNQTNVTFVNGTAYVLPKNAGKAVSDGKVYVNKTSKPQKKQQTITMTGRPSCSRCARNGCSYTWRTRTYINYCPNCHHYGTLGNRHKWGAVHEKEITCFNCDSDFCVNCGKEKYSWSNTYLRQ